MWRAKPPATFPDLLAKVRAATPPYDDEIAGLIESAYLRAAKAPMRVSAFQGIGLAAGVAMGVMLPVAIGLPIAIATAFTATRIARYRQRAAIARFCREATVTHVRALAPHGSFEHVSLVGLKELRLELPDQGQARVEHFAADYTNIPILFEPAATFLLAFDPEAGPHLGLRIPAELPTATLQLGA